MRRLLVLLAPALAAQSACRPQSPNTGGVATPIDMSATNTANPGPAVVTEKGLTVAVTLNGTALHVAVTDGATPVMTDAWLFTIVNGTPTPLTAFTEAAANKRRSRRFMMPCTLSGAPSGLVPCDQGAENGVITDLARETLANGVYTPAIKGLIDVTLKEAPTDPLLVVVAMEDQRYAGAAAVWPNGDPAPVPDGIGVPETHVARSYTKDVAPIIQDTCSTCHVAAGIAGQKFLLSDYEALVNRNYAYYEAKLTCEQLASVDLGAETQCIQNINRAAYMIERGAPAASNLMRRSVPDQNQSLSDTGLLWYGSRGQRFGATGDRRMPSTNITPVSSPDMAPAALPTYFDNHPEKYQLIWDWVAQGAPMN
jgi:hypothetical protein